jgi:cyanate permease
MLVVGMSVAEGNNGFLLVVVTIGINLSVVNRTLVGPRKVVLPVVDRVMVGICLSTEKAVVVTGLPVVDMALAQP